MVAEQYEDSAVDRSVIFTVVVDDFVVVVVKDVVVGIVVVVVNVHDFCTYSTYPFLMVAEQYEDSAVDRFVVFRYC
jgi:hypothetical protein